jgi:hypothetical protein
MTTSAALHDNIGNTENEITRSFAEFDSYVRRAEQLHAGGRFASAALSSAVAAGVAAQRHCGVFASPRLERILTAIGRSIKDSDARVNATIPGKPVRKVLHVGTQLAPVGGLTRMITRWVTADTARVNSLVLTQHRGSIPTHIKTSIGASGGKIHQLNHMTGGKLEWALALRQLAREFDAVVLHFHCEDVVPIIAFADPKSSPPVILLNHADHIFWLGPSISRVVVNLRQAASDITIKRRGVEERRSMIMPTIVDPTIRRKSREDAKRSLGIDPDKVVILSVARGVKYRTIDGITFADRHANILARNPQAKLIVVGVGNPADWEPVKRAYPGQLETLPEIENTADYFEAADIYVDSYPFVSSTSMMEAAGYGLPLLTIFDAPPEAQIFAINHVGLDGTSLVARSQSDYEAQLSGLLEDKQYRHDTGEKARIAVKNLHTPPGWLAFLERVYERAVELPPPDVEKFTNRSDLEIPFQGEPDCRHQSIVGSDFSAGEMTRGYLSMIPLRDRMEFVKELREQGALPRGLRPLASVLAPEWLKRRIRDR